jgi:pimeloyl-ACP methyl ester carboxylesterase
VCLVVALCSVVFPLFVVLRCIEDGGKLTLCFASIVVLDSAVRPADHPNNLQGPPMKKKKKLMPPQPTKNQYLLDYIFPLSVRKDFENTDTIVWKDDPLRFQKMMGKMGTYTPTDINEFVQNMSQRLRNLKCRLTVCWAEHSVFFQDPSIELYMKKELELYPPTGQTGRTPFIMVPDSYHHLMFDQPRMMVTILRTILSEWHAVDTGTGGKIGGTGTTGSGRKALNMSKM